MVIEITANHGPLTQLALEFRGAAKRIAGRRGRRLFRQFWPRRWPITAKYRELLTGRQALEIGGPTDAFGDAGVLPIYSCFKSLDGCNYAAKTIWRSEAFKYRQSLICEGTSLPLRDAAYDCVIASQCLEHLANPIKALLEWRRVLAENGILLLTLPCGGHGFDWRRPITTLEHLRQDFQNDTPETDLLHLDEVLALHDLSRDPEAGTPEQFKARCLRNAEVRAIHHHVFVPETASLLLREAGFSIVREDVQDWNIIILGESICRAVS